MGIRDHPADSVGYLPEKARLSTTWATAIWPRTTPATSLEIDRPRRDISSALGDLSRRARGARPGSSAAGRGRVTLTLRRHGLPAARHGQRRQSARSIGASLDDRLPPGGRVGRAASLMGPVRRPALRRRPPAAATRPVPTARCAAELLPHRIDTEIESCGAQCRLDIDRREGELSGSCAVDDPPRCRRRHRRCADPWSRPGTAERATAALPA